MTNFLVLYNPYYQQDVIVSHVKVLLSAPDQSDAKVAFGKIRSKLRDDESFSSNNIKKITSSIEKDGYMQLFLTDYADMYVAKVIEVTNSDSRALAPSYYTDKDLDVEAWFIMTDIRQVVDNDFGTIRDKILSNLTTPSFENHHYAIYGNGYQFPLEVCMDDPIDYFQEPKFPYYTDIFKSFEHIEAKRHLVHYRFGKEIFYALHPNSQESIISAEIEFAQNKHDTLYDFSSVIIKYSKAAEYELYLFIRTTMIYLMQKVPAIAEIEYQVQGHTYQIKDLQTTKPNIGTYKFLLGNEEIRNAISAHIQNSQLRNFLQHGLRFYIHPLQDIRNESAHGTSTAIKECETMRSTVMGIGSSGMLCDLIVNKKRFM